MSACNWVAARILRWRLINRPMTRILCATRKTASATPYAQLRSQNSGLRLANTVFGARRSPSPFQRLSCCQSISGYVSMRTGVTDAVSFIVPFRISSAVRPAVSAVCSMPTTDPPMPPSRRLKFQRPNTGAFATLVIMRSTSYDTVIRPNASRLCCEKRMIVSGGRFATFLSSASSERSVVYSKVSRPWYCAAIGAALAAS